VVTPASGISAKRYDDVRSEAYTQCSGRRQLRHALDIGAYYARFLDKNYY